MGKRERVRSRKQEKNKSNKHQFRASSTAGVAAEPKTGAPKPAEKASGGKAGGKAVAKVGAKKPRVSKSVSYSAETSILVVGDGDFTFSKGLVAHLGGSGAKVVATSFDSGDEVNKKYEKVRPVHCKSTSQPAN
jgi:hypothetical protein